MRIESYSIMYTHRQPAILPRNQRSGGVNANGKEIGKVLDDMERKTFQNKTAGMNQAQVGWHVAKERIFDPLVSKVSRAWYKVKNVQFFSPDGIITTKRSAGNGIEIKGP